MKYEFVAIAGNQIPVARDPVFQHILDTYASETNKMISTWRSFSKEDLAYRPHPRSGTVREILRYQLLSERRFFGEFLGSSEPPAETVLATRPAHRPSPNAIDCVPTAVEQARSLNLRTNRGRDLERRRSDAHR
jgi:hypothetical protein